MRDQEGAYLRIGELARRTGTSPELLRAWERRYDLLRPVRTPGGFRLYSERDERRIERMREQLRRGLSAAEAARLALAEEAPPEAEGSLAEAGSALLAAIGRYDEPAAQAVLDRLFGSLSAAAVVTEVVLPLLRELGERWRDGRLSVAHEHFATAVLRGRLLGIARGWDEGIGPRVLLACPPGEQHDLGLVAFGILLRRQGWRVVFLGADTPLETLASAVREARPEVVVLSAVDESRFGDSAEELGALAHDVPVALGGEGAIPAVATDLGALCLPADPAKAAALLTRGRAG